MAEIRAPFPWFGGKSRIAPLVWSRFGNVPNYVEPFAGSLAVLLMRPHTAQTETVNDRDAYLVNFWRAVAAAPDEVAAFADWPVSEIDLHARHSWILAQRDLVSRLRADPEFFDPKLAGWWVWGLSAWIGDGWCRDEARQMPMVGRGIHSAARLPHLSHGSKGVHSEARADLARCFGVLARRLRRTRVVCGEWARVVTPALTVENGVTGVLLDPPYASAEHVIKYSGGGDVSHSVEQWARENGENPLLRIALCGYEGEHNLPPSWSVVAWKAVGGYGLQGEGRGRDNAGRERVWFSPHCIQPLSLFSDQESENEFLTA